MALRQRCAYCGCRLLKGAIEAGECVPSNYRTRDHIVPTSRGGEKRAWVYSCFACNQDKFNLSINEWRAALMWRRRRPVLFWFERRIISNLLITWQIKLLTPLARVLS